MVFAYLAKLLYHPKYGHPSITCHNQGSFDMPGYATISHFKYFELNLWSSMYKVTSNPQFYPLYCSGFKL